MIRALALYLCLLCAVAIALASELRAIGGLKHEAAVIAGHMIVAVLQ